jgi:hypothetical protein
MSGMPRLAIARATGRAFGVERGRVVVRAGLGALAGAAAAFAVRAEARAGTAAARAVFVVAALCFAPVR